MLNSKTEALGIIFPNSYDAMVPDLVSERSDGIHSICQQIPHDAILFFPAWYTAELTIFPLL